MKRFALIIISSSLTLLGMEGLLRLTLDPDRLYSSLDTVPEWHAWKNRVEFWHERKTAGLTSFPGFDPLLGWDIADPDRYRSHHPDIDARRTVIIIGDSFTYGNDVAADENYPFLLDGLLPATRVLNMGVPGYGIDQAYLKYARYGDQYEPAVVVFGIYVGDYERTSSTFTAYAKPLFVAGSNGVSLTNQPVPEPQQVLAITEAEFRGRWYTQELMTNAWRKLANSIFSSADYYDATDRVIEHILRSLKRRLGTESTLLIVHIQRAEDFVARRGRRAEMNRRLLAIYARLKLNVLNLDEVFRESADGEEIMERYYVNFENGSIGHLSPAGNRLVAERIAAYLNERWRVTLK